MRGCTSSLPAVLTLPTVHPPGAVAPFHLTRLGPDRAARLLAAAGEFDGSCGARRRDHGTVVPEGLEQRGVLVGGTFEAWQSLVGGRGERR